jgi:hypothetical protein
VLYNYICLVNKCDFIRFNYVLGVGISFKGFLRDGVTIKRSHRAHL